MVAALKTLNAAHNFQDQDGGNDGQSDEDAKTGFECVSHKYSFNMVDSIASSRVWFQVAEVGVQKFLNQGVRIPLDLLRCADSQDPAFIDDRDAIGNPKCQFTIVRHY